MSKNVTISLSFNTSNGSYSLSTSDGSLAQISSDKQSFIIKGKTYTPTVNKSSVLNAKYRLNSYTMPSGSTVGTSRPTSTTSKTVNTTSDYTSNEVNYYTSHTTTEPDDYQLDSCSWDSSIIDKGSRGTLISSSNSTYGSSATYRVGALGGDYTVTKSISVNKSNGNVSGDTSYCTYSVSNHGGGSSTIYNPDIYAKFTFDASTGDISWSFTGTGSTNTTYTNKIKNNSTFDIDDLSTTTYTHDSTDWNVDDLPIIGQSKTSITIGVQTIA